MAQRRDDQPLRAARWGAWVRSHADRKGMTQTGLARASGGRLQVNTVNKWWNDKNPAAPEEAVITARILDGDVVDALRACGYDILAEEIAAARRGEQPTHDLPAADPRDAEIAALRAELHEAVRGVNAKLDRLERRGGQRPPDQDGPSVESL